jgi:hypothetical protein
MHITGGGLSASDTGLKRNPAVQCMCRVSQPRSHFEILFVEDFGCSVEP